MQATHTSRLRGPRSIGLRYMKERKGRTALTASGIALGVGLLVGVLIANRSTTEAFGSLIRAVTGGFDVLVSPIGTSPDAVVTPGEVDRIAATEGVRSGVVSYALEVEIDPSIGGASRTGGNQMWLDGVDPRADARSRGWTLLEGRFPRGGRDEIVVNVGHARDAGVRIGDRATIKTGLGSRTVAIAGIADELGVGGRAGGGSILVLGRIITSVETARLIGGVQSGFNTIAMVLDHGLEADDWVEEHRAELGGLEITTAQDVQRDFSQLLTLFGAALTWVASISLFIAGFLIFLTLSRAVIERTRVHGIMRAVGASPRQVRVAVLTEALAIGIVASAVGVLLGFGIAWLVTSTLPRLGFPPIGMKIDPRALVIGPVVGIATTLLSAVLPSRRASRVDPAEAIRGQTYTSGGSSRVWIIGIILVLLGIVAAAIDPSGGLEPVFVYGVTVSVLLGSVLLVPPVLRPLAWVLGRVTGRLARGTGDVSVRHLVRERSRSAYTLALIMIVLGGLFTFGAVDASMARAVDEVFESQYGLPDLLVRADNGRLAADAERRVASIPGVASASGVSFVGVRARYLAEQQRIAGVGPFETIEMYVVDPRTYFDVASFAWAAGSEELAKRELARGRVLMSESLARTQGVRRGNEITLETSRGPKTFRVAGTLHALLGLDVVVGAEDGRRYFNVRRPAAVLVRATDGDRVSEVRAALREEFESQGVTVQTMSSLREALERFGVRQLARIFFVILLVAAVIGLLGLANTLTMSVTERTREIAVMRATGASRGQVRRMVLCEAATLGLAAFVLALPLGWLMTTLVVRGASLEGLPLRLTYPATWVPVVAVIATLISALAALGPAVRAGRLRPAEALRFE